MKNIIKVACLNQCFADLKRMQESGAGSHLDVSEIVMTVDDTIIVYATELYDCDLSIIQKFVNGNDLKFKITGTDVQGEFSLNKFAIIIY